MEERLLLYRVDMNGARVSICGGIEFSPAVHPVPAASRLSFGQKAPVGAFEALESGGRGGIEKGLFAPPSGTLRPGRAEKRSDVGRKSPHLPGTDEACRRSETAEFQEFPLAVFSHA